MPSVDNGPRGAGALGLEWDGRGSLHVGAPGRSIVGLAFDFGGTLDADGLSWRDRFRSLWRAREPGVPQERIDAAIDCGDRAVLEHPRARQLRLADMVEAHVRAQARVLGADSQSAHAVAEKFWLDAKGALESRRSLLARLAECVRLAVVSNGCGNTRVLLAEHGLADFFEVVVDSTEAGVWKPDGKVFAPVLRAFACMPGSLAAVGDRIDRDVAAARSAGVAAILVSPQPPSDWSAGVDAWVSSVAALDPEAAAQ